MGVLAEDGRVTRKQGLAWREYAANEVEALARQARARRYASLARSLERVLPPGLRPLVKLAEVCGGRLPVGVEIPPSRSLNPADLPRLQAVCLAWLSDETLKDRDRKWRDRKLASLVLSWPLHVPASTGALTGPVALHATALEVGQLRLGPSRAGWLPVGPITVSRDGAPGFRPTFNYTEALE